MMASVPKQMPGSPSRPQEKKIQYPCTYDT